MLNLMRRFWYCGYLLHFNLHRNQAERKLCNSHEHYSESLLDQFHLSNCNLSKPTLLAFALSLQLIASLQKQKQRPVPQIVSSILNTSTISCPDFLQPATVSPDLFANGMKSIIKLQSNCNVMSEIQPISAFHAAK